MDATRSFVGETRWHELYLSCGQAVSSMANVTNLLDLTEDCGEQGHLVRQELKNKVLLKRPLLSFGPLFSGKCCLALAYHSPC